MDNIIEIIVFFFVIYSIFGSIFGKKKSKRTNGSTQPENQKISYRRYDDKKTTYKKPTGNQEILEELFGIKLPKTDNDYGTRNVEAESRDLENASWDPEREFEQKVTAREKYEYRNIEKAVPDIDYDLTSSLETMPKKKTMSEILHKQYDYKVVCHSRAKNFKDKLLKNQSVQELIILSEILAKPKALRKH
ncbi:MAG: hypothetical protein AB1521_06760 [Bacteroidota bacterium]